MHVREQSNRLRQFNLGASTIRNLANAPISTSAPILAIEKLLLLITDITIECAINYFIVFPQTPTMANGNL